MIDLRRLSGFLRLGLCYSIGIRIGNRLLFLRSSRRTRRNRRLIAMTTTICMTIRVRNALHLLRCIQMALTDRQRHRPHISQIIRLKKPRQRHQPSHRPHSRL